MPERAGTRRTARGWWCCRHAGRNGSSRAARAARASACLRREWRRGAAASSWQASWRASWQALGLLIMRRRSGCGALGLLEQQRLDDDRYHVGEFDDAPDVDVIEFLELHAVNRDHVSRGGDLVADDAAEALADIAVDQEHQRHVLLQRPRQRGANAGRDRVQAPMRGIAAPRERKRDRAFPFLEVGARERAANGGSDRIGSDVAIGREVAREYRQVL